jgi:hypothetical protein
MTFKALLADKAGETITTGVVELDERDLMPGDVSIAVDYSTVNFKDALAITGRADVIRQFPLIPGIDLAGTVEASSFPGIAIGDRVVANSWGLSQTHHGGYSQKARVKGEWLVKIPAPLSTKDAMAIGTAGYTAMLSVLALEHGGITPRGGDILVTGANGGVGSIAIAILSGLGYRVIASTGRPEEADYLRSWARRRSSIATLCRSREPLLPLKDGLAPSIPSAVTPWRTCWRKPGIAAWSPHAAWPRAWISPDRCSPSSCATSHWPASTPSTRRRRRVSRPGRVWRATSTCESSLARHGWSVSPRCLLSSAGSSQGKSRAERSSTSIPDCCRNHSARRNQPGADITNKERTDRHEGIRRHSLQKQGRSRIWRNARAGPAGR